VSACFDDFSRGWWLMDGFLLGVTLWRTRSGGWGGFEARLQWWQDRDVEKGQEQSSGERDVVFSSMTHGDKIDAAHVGIPIWSGAVTGARWSSLLSGPWAGQPAALW
jgi:hypothetical protein